jgi:hypothetical protein
MQYYIYKAIPIMVQNNTKNHRSQYQYPSRSNKKSIPSLSAQGQYPSRRSKRDRVASLVLVPKVNIHPNAVNGIE